MATQEEVRECSRKNWKIMADTEHAASEYCFHGRITNVHYLKAFIAAALSELYARRSGAVGGTPKESDS